MKFNLIAPPEIRFGPGESRKLPEIAARFGKRPFLVTGGRSFEGLPLAAPLARLPRWPVFGEPDVSTVDEATRRLRESGADVILGVGGGSVLDTAKAIAAMAVHEGSVRDYLEQVGRRTLVRPPLPFVAVPTTAGSGSEATKNAVIRVADLQVKRSIRHDLMIPRVAVVDPDLSAVAPRSVAASAGLDALTHLIEGYASTGADPMTDALALPGIRLAARGLRSLAKGAPDAESMALASLWGGIVLANAGLGAIHGLVAPLGGRCSIPHGTGCACLLVETLRMNLKALRARGSSGPALTRFEDVARALDATSFEAALESLKALRSELGVRPLGAYGVTAQDILPIVQASRGGSMRFNPVELTDGELETIVSESME